MLTVKEVAEALKVSQGAIYKAIHSGSLEHHRFGSAIRVTPEQLEAYKERTRVLADEGPFVVTRFKHL